jgi:alkanesulfonate monooxygenase SsuD/methylene tetrahydromethanopterin reductase-like flavin-dependent oxidoreductase (luciferase family)
VEFGLFIQNYVPASRRAVDPLAEHHAIMEDLQAVIAADKAGFKYVWATEHHFLDEYSHLSANDIVLGYLAHATERIHLGSGIFNPLPQVVHPAKLAERVAYLDHVSNGRFEFGSGRGAGSHEILGFLPGLTDTNGTKDIWEDVIGEFAKMWTQETYEGYEGKYWSLPPRKILPKPLYPPHPPMWYAAGNPASYEMAGRKGLGVLGFSVDEVEKVERVLTPYKKAVANAEPVGAYVNDNMLGVIAAYVAEDGQVARQRYVDCNPNYLISNVYRYHDTMPRPEGLPYWPDLIPAATLEQAEATIATGQVILGDPDEALAQCKRWEATGIDQIVFGIGPAPIEETLETIRLIGQYVIPKIDTDPEFRSNKFRAAAAAAG